MNIVVVWFMTPSRLINEYQRFGEPYCLNLQVINTKFYKIQKFVTMVYKYNYCVSEHYPQSFFYLKQWILSPSETYSDWPGNRD
jgi:hypothetical protein